MAVWRGSFVGHLSGIIAGFCVSFGWFEWVTPYWLYTSLAFYAVALAINVRETTSVHVPCVEIGYVPLSGALSPRLRWLCDAACRAPRLCPVPVTARRVGPVHPRPPSTTEASHDKAPAVTPTLMTLRC